MRYRPDRTVPGVNPPAGTESDEINRPTVGAPGRAPAAGLSAVGISEGEMMTCPQEEQNRLSAAICAEHFGHCINGDVVIGLLRTPPIMTQKLEATWR